MDTADQATDRHPRRAARVLVLDAGGRVLLLRSVDPARPDDPYWLTPGGGVEGSEDLVRCAVRELYEETGLRLPPQALSGPVWCETVDFPFSGQWYRQVQQYFVARVASWTVAPTGLTDEERRSWRGFRWWSVSEVEESDDRIYPVGLAGLVRSLDGVGS